MFVLRLLLLPYGEGNMRTLNSGFKTDQADLKDWMSFLPSALMEEIKPNTEETRSANP